VVLVRFSHTDSIATDVSCTRSWVAPVSGNAGQASITLPYDNPAADSRYIDMMGGSRVLVYDENGSGTWSGVVTQVGRDERSLRLTAVQDHAILGRLPVSLDGTMTHTSPAAVMYAALTNAGEVLGLHAINGPWDGFQPFVEAYAMGRKDVQAIASDMMNVSDGELHINTDTGAMSWCGPHAYTSLYPTVLRGNANLRDWSTSADAGDRVAQVIALDPDGTPYTATDTRAGGNWPAQAVINAPNRRAAQHVADTELANRVQSHQTVTGKVPLAHWDIRERQYVRVHVPRRGGIDAAQYTCRVMGRAVDSASLLMTLTLLIVDAIPTRPRLRPLRPTKALGRGTGSIAQRLVATARERAA
jgi:hypothetical protein